MHEHLINGESCRSGGNSPTTSIRIVACYELLVDEEHTFVLEITSPSSQQPVDVGKIALNTSMSMPGMAPMVADATLTPDKVPGRYLGTISFPDRGARQVTVTWDGPAGKGSTRFSVPVR